MKPEILPPAAPPDRPPAEQHDSWEQRIGKRWITWAGSLALFVAVALFFKMWVDTGGAARVFTPVVRIVLGGVFGLGLLYAGQRAARSLRALGQGLLGTGLAVLYLTVFAGFAYYHLYPRELAFALLITITAGGTMLAVRHHAQPIAMLSLLGGLVTPLMLSTGGDHRDALLLYVTILDLGVLAVALAKGWRALDWVAFVGTWVLFGGWYAEHYEAAAMVPTLAWLAVLFAVFLVMPFAFHLRRRVAIDTSRFALALTNALVMIGGARALLGHDTALLGLISFAMAAAYTLLGALTRRRLPDDGRAIFGFITLAMVFLTLAVPLRLEHHGITLGWAIEGPLLMALGFRYRYFPVRFAGLIVVGLATLQLLVVPWWLPSAMCVPLAGTLCALAQHRWRALGDERDRLLRLVSTLGSGLLAMMLIHWELQRGDAASWALAMPWVAGSFAYLRAGKRWNDEAAWWIGVVTAVVGGMLAMTSYTEAAPAWALFFNPRFAVALGAVGLGLAIGGEVIIGVALFALWSLLSVETHGHFATSAHGIGGMALTIVWGACAIALVAGGLGKHVRALRFAGLALFGLTAGKLVLVDLATVEQGFRVLSFLVVGLLMIGASYLYHRLATRAS